jgi:hypothetical protein
MQHRAAGKLCAQAAGDVGIGYKTVDDLPQQYWCQALAY